MAELTKRTHAGKRPMSDPVCGMSVRPRKRTLSTGYRGIVYYFCAEECRKAFEMNPHQYLKFKAPKRKNWWKRYLERLNRCTGGKPLKCH